MTAPGTDTVHMITAVDSLVPRTHGLGTRLSGGGGHWLLTKSSNCDGQATRP